MQSDVCVIGNGVVGKTAALGLAQAGYKITLLSPTPHTQPTQSTQPTQPTRDATSQPADLSQAWDTRVYALNSVARTLLESLKVWNALDAGRIATINGMVVNGDGTRAGQLVFDAYGAHRTALAWVVEDSNLNQALDAALRFAPNVRCITGSGVRLHIDAASAQVDVTGSDDNVSSISAALIVGADGANSWVRAQAEIGVDYRPYEQRAVVANFSCSIAHQGVAHQWFNIDEGVIALLPLAGNRLSLVWSAPDALADILLNESATELAHRLSALPGQPFGTLVPLQPETVRAIPLALVRAHQTTSARLVLVGDAAHAIHPLAGQGMNLGFADVAALLTTLGTPDATRDCGDARVLASYARSRKEKVLLMQIGTDGLQRLFASPFEPLRIMRNLGLDLLNKFPHLKRQLMSHAAGDEL